MESSELRQLVDRYKSFGSYPMGTMTGKMLSKIYKTYLKLLRYCRGIFLMNMYHLENSDFFDIPSVPELFESIYVKCDLHLSKQNLMVIQNISHRIRTVYNHSIEFAVAIDHWSKEDISSFPVFAYSTFPGIYCYFTGIEFIEQAVEFMCHYFRVSHNLLTSKTLITSFFSSATSFYSSLWRILGKKLDGFSQRTSFDTMFEGLLSSLTLAMQHLTASHIKVIQFFDRTFPAESITCLVELILLNPFIAAMQSSPELSRPLVNARFVELLKEIAAHPQDIQAVSLLSVLVNHRTFNDIFPRMSAAVWSKGVPTLISDRDILIMLDIFNICDDCFSCKILPTQIRKSQSLRPIAITIYPAFCGTDPPEVGFGHLLFGDRPPSINAEIGDESRRIWNKLIEIAAQKGEKDFTNYVMTSGVFQKRPDLEVELETLLLQYFCENFMCIENIVVNAEHEDRLKNLLKVATINAHELFHRFSYRFIRNQISHSSKEPFVVQLTKAIESVVRNSDTTYEASFEICCTAFDVVRVEQTVRPGKIDIVAKFESVLRTIMETEWTEKQKLDGYSAKTKYVMDCIPGIMSSKNLSTGKVLKIMLKYVADLDKIVSDLDSEQWKMLFAFGLFCANVPEIILVFFFFHYYVFPKHEVIGRWTSIEMRTLWEKFSAGIWNIFARSPELCEECSWQNQIIKISFA